MDGAKHPAIIWLIGGFSNSISGVAWSDYPPDNDQSAKAFREAGIVGDVSFPYAAATQIPARRNASLAR